MGEVNGKKIEYKLLRMRNRKGHQKEKQYRRLAILKNADMAQYNSVIGLNFFAYVATSPLSILCF